MTEAKTINHDGKTYHVLQPGERLLRDGSWLKADGTPGRGGCVDAKRASAWSSAKTKGGNKGRPKRRARRPARKKEA